MLRLTLASIRLYRRRYTATALAIVLGVAFCAATFAVTDAMKKGLGDALVAQYSAADVVVQPDAAHVRAAELSAIEALPESGALTVADSAWLPVSWEGSGADSYSRVGEIASDASLRWQTLEGGSFPAVAGEVAVTQAVADRDGLALGDPITLGEGRMVVAATVVGLVATIEGGTTPDVFVADGLVEDWRRAGGHSEVLVKAAAGTSAADLAAAVSGAVDSGLVLTSDEIRTQATSGLTDDVDLLGWLFKAFAAIALFVAALVIANTFSIVLAQRSRDLAMMRCIGALRRQVLVTVLAEALVLGVAAAVVGTAAGLGLGAALVSVLNQSGLSMPMALTAPTVSGLLIPLVMGVLITVLAACGPARRATRIAPLAALRPEAAEPVTSRPGLIRALVGVFLIATGVLGLQRAMGDYDLLVGVIAGCVAFLGVLALTPAVVPALIRLVDALRSLVPRRLRGGVPASLSVANSLRNPRRTAATTSALLIGVTLISLLVVGASSLGASATTAIDHNNPVDVVLSGGRGVSPSVVERVRETEGIADVVALDAVSVPFKRGRVLVASVDTATARGVVRDEGLVAELGSGQAFVPQNYAHLTSYGRRTLISLDGVDGSVDLDVSGSRVPNGPVLVPADVLAQLGGQRVVGSVWISVEDGQDSRDVMGDLEEIVSGAPGDLSISGGYTERSTLDRALGIMLLVASGLLGMAIVIALVGVSNTLSLSVVERTREQALLRALGMTKRQQRAMLAAEALLMSAVAALLGVALGIGFGWAATVTTIGNVTQQPAVLDVPWGRLCLIVLGGLLAGLLASLLPARRASRIAPASALAEA